MNYILFCYSLNVLFIRQFIELHVIILKQIKSLINSKRELINNLLINSYALIQRIYFNYTINFQLV
jgi:hypothetical protein